VATTATASVLRDANWQEKDGEELATTLARVFTIVRDENEWRTGKDEYHWGLYEGTGVGGITTKSRKGFEYENATLPDNVCKMAVDTLTAKVATIRPIPQVLTSRGNWKDQRRARKLRQFGEGEFFRQKIHEELAPRIIKDSLVSRAGVVQVHVEHGARKPTVERVYSWTLYVDDWDAESGEPATIHRLRTMDRGRAMRMYGKGRPDLRDKIKNAGHFSSLARHNRDEERCSTVDRVELLETFFRCIGHDDMDPAHKCEGRHVIVTNNGALLVDEEWHKGFFPFASLTYDTPNTGYWGTGLVQTLEGYQVSINDANCKANESLEHSGKMVILRDGSGVFEQDIQNGLRIGHARPGPYEPTVFDMNLADEVMMERAPELVQRALNAAGVSQMSAQSQKPAGVEAGIALQTLDDIESQRHIVFGRRFESWCMNVMRLLIECAKDLAKRYGDYAVQVPLKGAFLDLKWSDVHVDGFQLQLQSVGALYTSFAGRLDKLKTLFEMGAIDAQTFMRHLDAGDLQSELDLETVDRICVDEMIEAMLDSDKADTAANDNGDYLAPNGYLPLAWAHKRAHQRRLQAQMDGAPQHVLDLLTRFIDDCDFLMTPKVQNAQAVVDGAVPPGSPPMPTGPGPGAPAPPPMGGQPILPMGVAPAGDQLMTPPPMAA
jgi:hypothetical protein